MQQDSIESTNKFNELVEKALKDRSKGRYGFSINPPKDIDPSELFLGEYTANKNQAIEEEDKNAFINKAAYYPKSKEDDPRFESITKCEILTLSNKDDLIKFNEFLTARNNPKSTIKILTMDKQYSQSINTWQVFIIYEVIKPINIVKP